MLDAEAAHRGHAIIEQVIADLKDSALAHAPEVILSRFFDRGSYLRVCVADGVVDGGCRARWSAGSDQFRSLVLGRVAAAGSAEDRRRALLAEGVGERVA